MTLYKKNMRFQPLKLGFTLIELMITVAIIGILVGIAYPNFQSSIMKSRRVDAQAALMGFANAMERFSTVNNVYPSAGVSGIYAATSPVGGTIVYYQLLISTSTNVSYELQAVPTGAQSSDQCGTLTIDQAGVRGFSGLGMTVADCW